MTTKETGNSGVKPHSLNLQTPTYDSLISGFALYRTTSISC